LKHILVNDTMLLLAMLIQSFTDQYQVVVRFFQ